MQFHDAYNYIIEVDDILHEDVSSEKIGGPQNREHESEMTEDLLRHRSEYFNNEDQTAHKLAILKKNEVPCVCGRILCVRVVPVQPSSEDTSPSEATKNLTLKQMEYISYTVYKSSYTEGGNPTWNPVPKVGTKEA